MGTWYKDLLLDPRWQEKRARILARDKVTCKLCYDNRTTVCAHCHDVIHALPDCEIIMVEKSISLQTGCWCIVAYTENEMIFLYLFLDTYKHEIITIFPNENKAA